jgi:hypothetical protein
VLAAMVSLVRPASAVVRDQTRRGPLVLVGRTPTPVSSGQARLAYHLSTRLPMRLTFELRPKHADELQQFVAQVQRPGSAVFHRFLSFDQWKARYAPSDADVRRVVSWASSRGLTTVQRFADNLAVVVDGSVGNVERALGIGLNSYALNGKRFYANDRDPVIDTSVSDVIKDVVGLDSLAQVHAAGGPALNVDMPEPRVHGGSFIARSSMQGNAGKTKGAGTASVAPSYCCDEAGKGLEPGDLWSSQAYDLGVLQGFGHCCNPTHNPNGTPKEESIAIIGNNAPSPGDLRTFFTNYGLAWNIDQVDIGGASCCDKEMTLDTEWAGAMSNSRGASADTAHIYVYEGEGTLIEDTLESWQTALSDNKTRVASTSFGGYEDLYGGLFEKSISDFTDVTNPMVAMGWSIAAAAGDNGAYDDCSRMSVEYPATDPNVVAVGGTTLTMKVAGAKVTYGSEAAWTGNGCGGQVFPGAHNGGGGGGCSNTFIVPSWQDYQVSGCLDSSGDHPPRRSVPDLSLNAGTGQAIYYLGNWTSVGGTSIAAPEMAGFFAQVNAYLGYIATTGDECGAQHNVSCVPMGNPGPAIWTNALTTTPFPRNPFYDITTGCNGGSITVGLAGGLAIPQQGYCTKPGYDLATGFGSANLFQLAWVLMHWTWAGGYGLAPYPSISFGGPATAAWYNTDRTVSFNISGAPGIAGYTAAWDLPPLSSSTKATPGTGDAFWDGPQNVNSSVGTLSLAAAGTGCHTAFVTFWTNLGVEATGIYGSVCFDNAPPTISCGSADGQWHANDVSIACTASDALSGLANSSDASFSLSTHVSPGTETADAQTDTRQVCDVAGNCATAGPIGGNMVDEKPPDINIAAPTASDYAHSATITLDYGATDGGAGLQSITATLDGSSTVAGHGLDSGQDINLLTDVGLGQHTFTVQAIDNVGNVNTQSVTFNVVVTAASIKGDVNQFLGSGAISSPGIANSLLSKLDAAAAARARGACSTGANIYQAFNNEVTAQTGITITPPAGAIMKGDALYLIAHCP